MRIINLHGSHLQFYLTFHILIIVDLTLAASPPSPPFVTPIPDCKTPCTVPVRNSNANITELVDCQFIKDTYDCEMRSRALISAQPSSQSVDLSDQHCPLSKIRANFTPYVYDHPNFKAFVSLNLTLSVYDPSTQAVAIRLICLKSGPQPEFYCENRTRPTHWDQFYWPCRLFDYSQISSAGLLYPLQFNHDCFRMSLLSIFMINVTLYPENCVASYVFRMPSIANVQTNDIISWLPLVTVDINTDDGIWIYFSPPPSSMKVRRIVVEIQEFLPNDAGTAVRTVLRRRDMVTLPETSIFLKDFPEGSYSAVVYAQHTLCEEEKCPQMQVPFNLTKDHYTLFTREQLANKSALENAWVPATAAIIGVVVAFVVIAFTVIAYLRWKANRRKRQQCTVSYVQFTRRPVVLILYTNDFAQHRRCVLELATYLQNRANCEIELDEWAMTSTARKYRSSAEWLMQALQRADYFLIVFSAGGKETVFRNTNSSTYTELKSERPWEEVFAPAVNFILQRIFQAARNVDASIISRTNVVNGHRSNTAFDKYLCVYFSYSSMDVVPDLFQTLPCPKFGLSDELRQLVCHIHEWPSDTVYENAPMDADRLNSSILEASKFIDTNPDWLNAHLVQHEMGDGPLHSNNDHQRINEIYEAIDRLRGPSNVEIPENLDEFYSNLLEQNDGAHEEKYLLVPPSVSGENNQRDESGSRFDLVPPDDEELESLFYSNGNMSKSQGGS